MSFWPMPQWSVTLVMILYCLLILLVHYRRMKTTWRDHSVHLKISLFWGLMTFLSAAMVVLLTMTYFT